MQQQADPCVAWQQRPWRGDGQAHQFKTCPKQSRPTNLLRKLEKGGWGAPFVKREWELVGRPKVGPGGSSSLSPTKRTQ